MGHEDEPNTVPVSATAWSLSTAQHSTAHAMQCAQNERTLWRRLPTMCRCRGTDAESIFRTPTCLFSFISVLCLFYACSVLRWFWCRCLCLCLCLVPCACPVTVLCTRLMQRVQENAINYTVIASRQSGTWFANASVALGID